MNFKDFIEKIGAADLAIMLQCTEATVYKWKNAQSAPRPETAYILTKISHGQLSLESIFMPYIEKQLKGTKFLVGSTDSKTANQLEFNF